MTVNPLAPVGPAWFRDLHNIEHRQFNFDRVNPDANGNFDFSSQTYLESLDFIASWVAGLSAIYLTVLLIVGLARCCGCCKPKTRKPSRHGFLTIMLFLVGAAALVCCIVGSHIIESATEDVDTMAATLQQPVTALTALAAATNTSLPSIVRHELNKAPNSSQYILELDSVVALMTSVVVKSGEIANDVPSLDVSTRTHDARVALHWTRVGLSIFFSLFLSFVFLLPCTRRPCVRWLYLIFAFLFLVFLSIGRGGAFGALVGLSDMCHNVTGQILIIADNNSDVEYYLACNASAPSPSEPLITDALADVTTAATSINDIIAFLAERHLDASAARGIARELSGFNSTLVSSLPGLSCEAIQPTYTHIVDEGCWTMSKLGLAIVCLAFGLGLLLCASMITVIVREPTSALPAYAELEMEESAPLLRKGSSKVATNDFSGYKIAHPLNY